MRVIGGAFKGKKLHSLRGTITRPTSDRLRESIFDIIAFEVKGAFVLDLFAGTGAFAIEALSRGAEFAVFIDNTKNAISIIRENIKSCMIDSRAKVIKWDIKRNLNCIKLMSPPFNLVFIDPPYNKNFIKPALSNLRLSSSMENGALIIVEHSNFESIPEEPVVFKLTDQRRYGKTLVSFLNYMV